MLMTLVITISIMVMIAFTGVAMRIHEVLSHKATKKDLNQSEERILRAITQKRK